jgi:hypothetical protein
VDRPLEQICRVYSALGLEHFESVRPRLEAYLAEVAGHKRNRLWISTAQKKAIDKSWGDIIRQKGYTWTGCQVDLSDDGPAE